MKEKPKINEDSPDYLKISSGQKVMYLGEILRLMKYSYAVKSEVHWWAKVRDLRGKIKFVPAKDLIKLEKTKFENKIVKKDTPRIRWYKNGKLTIKEEPNV